ncbi:uncharacterized protein LOC132750545 [Ruditapes philippinarum]|uniref:uncharacterized protein LOC132750545 n=1 Tax=Ruditapes philippinarum TaxID=129788 RepID=UPI00295C29F8|nr:uncharacterized protein LOC132750545 [Ruditapes philippinarum]
MTDNAEKRDTYIRRMCRISAVIIVVSVACVIVGILSIVQSAPKFLFPYCLGGSMIAGLFVISLAVCNLKLYCNYVKHGREHEEEYEIKVWVCRQIVVIALTFISLAIGIGVSGIWGMVKATDVINFEKTFNMTSKASVPYAKANLPYAVSSFVLVLILAIVQTVLWCTCLSYTDTYGFTENTGYSRRHGTSLYRRYRPRPNITSSSLNLEINSRLNHNNTQSGHSPDIDHGSRGLRVNIPTYGDNHRQVPSAPSRDRSSQLNDLETGHTSLNDNEGEGQPPSYDHGVEEPPPSYNEVLKEGGFKVSYV